MQKNLVFSKSQAKDKIRQLVEKYQSLSERDKKSFTEEETRKDFITPLFEALGWNVTNKIEVTAEETQSAGRVDYGFYINGHLKFFLEAKSLKVDLNNEEFAKQAIRYSWNRGADWAVLTDFEGLKVFYAQAPSKYLQDKKYFELSFQNYIADFEKLWELSRESFEQNLIDQNAIKAGKMPSRVSVDSQLYKDLNGCREILTEKLGEMNDEVPPKLLEEGVQKILNRLIFIRVAEDREVEDKNLLLSLIRQWETSDRKKTLFESMVDKFRELDEIYNSNLFSPHPLETWHDYSNATKRVAEILKGKSGYYEYDFKAMPADVLGKVYENYLGWIARNPLKPDLSGKSGKLFDYESGKELKDKSRAKRKEQGIYYTPTFIVNYIVENALKPVLDKCKTMADLKKIKVLDPACGSGSFLIRALDVINEKYKEFGAPGNEFTKIEILQNNIYGVDLDEQAVEIARLNLLINSLDCRFKFPELTNIRCGNSLISGSDEELKKYFGPDFSAKKPFNWKEEFPDVFSQSGFDVVIGNPPWGANIDEDVKYFESKFPNSTKEYKDTYKLFIDKSLDLLKIEGRLGLIVPSTFLYQPRYADIKLLIQNQEYYAINLGEHIFPNVQLPSCMLILIKNNKVKNIIVDLTQEDRQVLPQKILSLSFDGYKKIESLMNKINKQFKYSFCDILDLKDAGVKHQRVDVGKSEKGKSDLRERIYYEGVQKDSEDKPLFIGSDVNRYYIELQPKFFLKHDFKTLLKDNEIVYFDKRMMDLRDKIVWRQTSDCIRATLLDSGWFANTLQVGVVKPSFSTKLDIKFVLAVLNSKLIDFLYKQKVFEQGRLFPQVKLRYLYRFPFPLVSATSQRSIVLLVDKMLNLNKKLHKLPENSNEWRSVKHEIEFTDRKIDGEVYKLYSLTPKEIEVVERKDK